MLSWYQQRLGIQLLYWHQTKEIRHKIRFLFKRRVLDTISACLIDCKRLQKFLRLLLISIDILIICTVHFFKILYYYYISILYTHNDILCNPTWTPAISSSNLVLRSSHTLSHVTHMYSSYQKKVNNLHENDCAERI